MEGMNISSRSCGLAGALTNPTTIAFRKGNISQQYPVTDKTGKVWADAEAAYKHYRTGDLAHDMSRMTKIIAAKLTQHPELIVAINKAGGTDWLKTCNHLIGVKDSRWEGIGTESAFIRCLVAAYDRVSAA